MNRRGFLKSLFTATATVVVAPEIALDILDEVNHKRKATYFIGGIDRKCTCGYDYVAGLLYKYQRALLPPCPVHGAMLQVHDSVMVELTPPPWPNLQNIPRRDHIAHVEAIKVAMREWGRVT